MLRNFLVALQEMESIVVAENSLPAELAAKPELVKKPMKMFNEKFDDWIKLTELHNQSVNDLQNVHASLLTHDQQIATSFSLQVAFEVTSQYALYRTLTSFPTTDLNSFNEQVCSAIQESRIMRSTKSGHESRSSFADTNVYSTPSNISLISRINSYGFLYASFMRLGRQSRMETCQYHALIYVAFQTKTHLLVPSFADIMSLGRSDSTQDVRILPLFVLWFHRIPFRQSPN
jgi:hypothetical protein